MKKMIYGALLGLISAIIILFAIGRTNGAPVLTYVYSNSMEPLIKVNDAFLVLPEGDYQIGDIIMYRPMVLQAPYITHRIIGKGEKGYLTKGDNSPFKDQDSNEPEVIKERIIGKVFTINGQPLIIPGLGHISKAIQKGLGRYTSYLSVIFLMIGILSAVKSKNRKRKPRHRLRLKHIYRAITVIAVIVIVLSIYLGSRVTRVKYLVSEYPGTLGDQVQLNQPGQLSMEVSNKGLVPVWSVLKAIEPLSISQAPEYIKPLSKEAVILDVVAQRETGLYQGYVQIYNYPILLPRSLVVTLHNIHPMLALMTTGLSFGLYMSIIFKAIGRIHGLEEWIPLRAIKDKLTARRMKRIKASLIGKRRIRS